MTSNDQSSRGEIRRRIGSTDILDFIGNLQMIEIELDVSLEVARITGIRVVSSQVRGIDEHQSGEIGARRRGSAGNAKTAATGESVGIRNCNVAGANRSTRCDIDIRNKAGW